MQQRHGTACFASTPAARTAIAAFLVACATVCRAQDKGASEASRGLLPVPDYGGDVWSRPYLTGDWGGARTDLANKGLQFDVRWTQYLQSVVDGGRDTGTEYGGHLAYQIKLDLMRMGILPGALVQVRAESRYGETVNRIAGPILPANTAGLVPLTDELDEDLAIAVTSLNYTQFLSEKLAVIIGKVDTFGGDPNEFASGRGATQFLNFNLNFSAPTAILPYSTLAAGVVFLPNEDLTITSLVGSLNDSSTTTGFDELDEWFWSIESQCQYRLGRLPGGFNVGGAYAWNGEFADLKNPFIFLPGEGLRRSTDDTSWLAYLSVWQYLSVEGDAAGPVNLANGVPDRQGWGLFSRIAFADEDTNPARFSASIGLGGRGIIPGRDDDLFGIGCFYIDISDSPVGDILSFDDQSQGVEAFYSLAVAKPAFLSFAVQVLDAPTPNADTAVILGLRLRIDF